MKTRLILTLAFLFVSSLLIGYTLKTDPIISINDFFLNLGTEIIGIVLTVAIVDWLFDRKKKIDEVKKISWRALHLIDHAIWVWKGGSREFDINELCFLIDDINENDDLPRFTQNMLIQIASKSENEILCNSDIISSNKYLEKAMISLKEISQIRDDTKVMSNEQIKSLLMGAIQNFKNILNLKIESFNILGSNKYYDSSIKMQEWRHFGIEEKSTLPNTL
jgi:hypothetical protein